jgi:hypothetical protein
MFVLGVQSIEISELTAIHSLTHCKDNATLRCFPHRFNMAKRRTCFLQLSSQPGLSAVGIFLWMRFFVIDMPDVWL